MQLQLLDWLFYRRKCSADVYQISWQLINNKLVKHVQVSPGKRLTSREDSLKQLSIVPNKSFPH